MIYLFIIILFFIILVIGFSNDKRRQQPPQQPMHFDLHDDHGDPIKNQKVKVVIGRGDSDAPVQKLKYFCIKDKGYHVTVWPKDVSQFDIVEFNIAGMSHRDNIDEYIGEHSGTLEAEPTNPYDVNAIKILAEDCHHGGYVPKDMTAEVRKNSKLPCRCYFYIGKNDGFYFSDCYIKIKT